MKKLSKPQSTELLKSCLILGFLLLLPVFLLSCAKAPVYYNRPNAITPQDTRRDVRNPNLSAAMAAYSAGDYSRAETMAEAFLKSSPSDIGMQIEAWRIIADASSAQFQPNKTITALENWQKLSSQAKNQEAWLTLWSRALNQLPYATALPLAADAAVDSNNPWQLQLEGKLFIQENRLKTGLLEGLPQELERIYTGVPYADARKKMEQRLFNLLHRADQPALASLAKQVDEKNEKNYPYALFRLEESRRLYLDSRTQELARETVSFLKEDSLLADQSLFRSWVNPDLSVLSGLKANSSNLALILPLSGQYGNLSGKIVTGAELACAGFSSNGNPIQLHIIDSDRPGWLQELAHLPDDLQLVGGPLRLSDYQELKTAGELNKRKFFTFLRSLEGEDEGKTAWRFFSSSTDELDAVIRFSRNLGIEYFGALIPEEDYGKRMLSLFKEQVEKNAAHLSKILVYPANKHQEWNKLIATFLHTSKEAANSPRTPFQALFIPDSWQNSTIMFPNFFYYREHRQLFIGTMLWEQGITMQQHREGDTTRMVIFPGAWDMQSTSPTSMILRAAMAASGTEAPDFWVSLGYDFVNMAASLPIQQNSSTDEINNALNALNVPDKLPWSGAPITWTNHGKASQLLFVFTPAEQGFILADPDKFRAYYQKAWQKDPFSGPVTGLDGGPGITIDSSALDKAAISDTPDDTD
jgi:hypothetical protein